MDHGRRRGQIGLVLAGGVVVAAGLAVGLVAFFSARYDLPKASIWIVVGAAMALVALIRALTKGK